MPSTAETGETVTHLQSDSLISSVTLADIEAAAERIAPYIHRTPIFTSDTLDRLTGARLGLKAEFLQRTGSFKARGAINAMLQLSPAQRERGVITLSAGNHGQGVAYAAQITGVRCVVCMPETAVPTKIAAIRGYGAEVIFAQSMNQVHEVMELQQTSRGLHYVHPFGDAAVIAGQGTVALELLADMPDLDAVIMGVGGGGLLSGVAVAMKALRPTVRVIGVEPEGAAVVSKSLAAGSIQHLDEINTIADGLSAPFSAPLSQALIERYVDDVILVSDPEIIRAIHFLIERAKLVVEPAGSAGLAALLTGRAGIETGAVTGVILSGGNVDRQRLAAML